MDRQADTNDSHLGYESIGRQFGIIDLFTMVTFAAVLFAIACPFIRDLPETRVQSLYMFAAIQTMAVVGAFLFASNRRTQLHKNAGARLCVGFCGQGTWKHWPMALSGLAMLICAVVQVGFIMVLLYFPFGLMNPILLIQLCAWSGWTLARYFWRVFPNSIEYFEKGIALGGTKFIPWSSVTVRPSALFPNRIVTVYRHGTPPNTVGDTKVVQVPEEYRQYLLNIVETVQRQSSSAQPATDDT